MFVIGLTGGTGSGKSVVSGILAKENVLVADCDKIARETVEPNKPAYNEIVGFFGKDILLPNGGINRKRLGEIVFSDSEKLKILNSCSHKYICEEIENIIERENEKSSRDFIVIDAPLLIEAGLKRLCDEVWVVCCDAETRIKRIMQRDGITRLLAEKRIASQKSQEEYEKIADKIIYNEGDTQSLTEVVKRYLKDIDIRGAR